MSPWANRFAAMVLLGLCARTLAAAPASLPSEILFVRAYELERSGEEIGKAVALYETIVDPASSAARALRANALFRIGVCKKKLGLTQEAQSAWRRVAVTFPGESDWVELAAAELAHLAASLEWMTVRGRVVDASGAGVAGAYVLAGQWLFEPPIITGKDGSFVARRKAVRSGGQDPAYCLVYAEHARLPMAGIAVASVASNNTAVVNVAIRPTITFGGRVADTGGRPIEGARVTVGAFFLGGPPVHIPYHLLMGPSHTDRSGNYETAGLVQGLRYQIEVEKEGTRSWTSRGIVLNDKDQRLGDVILEPTGQSSVSGMVTDTHGQPLDVRVTALTVPPGSREIASARTAADGSFRIPYLPEAPLTIRAESPQGYATRSVTGIPAGTDHADLTLIRASPIERAAEVGGVAPEIRAVPVNVPSVALAPLKGRVVLLYFLDRERMREALRELKRIDAQFRVKGLAVICVHDHSGFIPDLCRIIEDEKIGYAMAIDEYAPTGTEASRNSATMGLYGCRSGDIVMIDGAGRIADILPFFSAADRKALTVRAEALLDRSPRLPSMAEAGRHADVVGQKAPELRVAKWIRGEPLNGGPVVLNELVGRAVVLYFSSAYVAASIHSDYPDEASPLEQLVALYGDRGAAFVWILPSSDNSREVESLVLGTVRGVPIGVDRNGETYREYGVTSYSYNCVIGADGRVYAVGSSNAELFRMVKRLVWEQGSTP